MKLNQLRDPKGAKQSRWRIGRGIGSGRGKTSGRGHKGFKSRAGSAVGAFEGGQTPLHMRLPKRGFGNRRFRKLWRIVNLGRLQDAIDAKRLDISKKLTAEHLKEAGLARHPRERIRLLAKGEISAAVKIEAAGASKKALEKVEAAGGKVHLIAPKTRAPKTLASKTPSPKAAKAVQPAKAPKAPPPKQKKKEKGKD